MVKRLRPELVALALAALGLGGWSWFQATGARALTELAARSGEARAAESPLPKIALERLKQDQAEASPEGGPARDVFHFGRSPAPSEPPRPASLVTQPSVAVDMAPPTPLPPPTLPPFGVKYIGTVEQRGVKIAVLLSDEKKEVLTGREGDTVANRLRIVRIGIESVEVQDVGSERVRKIPLKGN